MTFLGILAPIRIRLATFATLLALVSVQPAAYAQFQNSIGTIIEIEGSAEVSFKDGPWLKAKVDTALKAGDRLRTGEFSRASVKGANGAIHRLGEMTTMRFGSVTDEKEKEEDFSLLDGFLYFFSRKPVSDKSFSTERVTAAIKGTEFVLIADPQNGDTIHMIDGEVELTTPTTQTSIGSGDVAKADSKGAIETYQGVRFGGPIDWFAYYPAVLIVDELAIEADSDSPLGQSISQYKNGDYSNAVTYLQSTTSATRRGEAIYRAALAITVGRIEQAKEFISNEQTDFPEIANALSALVSTIQGNPGNSIERSTPSPTALIATSYALQARGNLTAALAAVQQAKSGIKKPSGIALARESELLFSLGRYAAATQSASEALEVSPGLASAKTTLGFLNSVIGNQGDALALFEECIEQDPSYAEAWLGRGLLKIRKGATDEGLSDIETAVALSPRRATFRAYLGRMFAQQERWDKADTELQLAAELDPSDPNIALITALLASARNDTATAVSALHRSIDTNDTRSVFRSSTLLAEDLALRTANLAQVYADADIPVIALREASIAFDRDPGSVEAHRFLAGSYESLQDPATATLRYQSPFQSERLAYNLLAPARSGLLPIATSPNNYYNLLSPPDSSVQLKLQAVAEYGLNANATYSQTHDRYSVTLGGQWNYLEEYAEGWNFDRRAFEAGFKADLANQDTVTVIARTTDRKSTDPEDGQDLARYDESFPSALIGYRRAWNAENETVAYLQFVSHDIETNDTDIALVTNPSGNAIIGRLPGDTLSSSQSNAIQAEVQHRYTRESASFIAGLRGQAGDWQTTYTLTDPVSKNSLSSETDQSFDRTEGYLYGYFFLPSDVTVTAGSNLTRFSYPVNAFTLPPAEGRKSKTRFLPKLGLSWKPESNTTLRAAYAKSLGGLALDDGYRLEPTQVAGFLQGYRTLLAEEIDGTHPAVEFDVYGVGVTYSSDSKLFFDLELNVRESSSDRGIGHFVFDNGFTADSWRSETTYREKIADASLSYLIGKSTTVSLGYNYTDSDISSSISDVRAEVERSGQLSSIQLRALTRTQSGFFASLDLRHLSQATDEATFENDVVIDSNSRSGTDHLQLNLECGWRDATGRRSVALGAKNVLDDDDRIDPITWTPSLYPRRILYLSAAWQF